MNWYRTNQDVLINLNKVNQIYVMDGLDNVYNIYFSMDNGKVDMDMYNSKEKRDDAFEELWGCL